MSFTDMIKKSVLESFAPSDITGAEISIVLIGTFLIALYIFFVYRYITRTSFYNKNFAVSMAIISVVTAGIILAMQSSLVISLGMVGALSIVRFRTAIKEPLDLLFLFWSIGTGIVVGAGLFSVGVILAVFVTIGLVVLQVIPSISSPELLIVKLSDKKAERGVFSLIDKYSSSYKVDSKAVTKAQTTLIVEVKTKDGNFLVDEISELDGVGMVTLMEHQGEVKN
ncbi:DUF4956 domain-containing protein [Pseudobutyrivibrio sp. MD2005]|uniref:DUF4956 domain-containing protein n=1 Tax=Pseudobutyrivibrio sp. MD2005 TaxID=1410616 RepID=UPI000487DC4E|nr:DUF4956 domain-containing protein [Pseudobutyrivibrio sp. MD2005]